MIIRSVVETAKKNGNPKIKAAPAVLEQGGKEALHKAFYT